MINSKKQSLVAEEGGEEFLRRVRARVDRVGIDLPEIEIRYEHLSVEGYVHAGSRALPSLINATLNSVESVAEVFSLTSSKKRKIQILEDASGIIRPSRMTLLLGPPGAGKTTFLLSLAGQLHHTLKKSGKVTYCGHDFSEFIPQRTCGYVSQHDLHHGEMTVRETLDFSARCLGVGQRLEIFKEINMREEELGSTKAEDDSEFVKATFTDYILKILGLDVCSDTMVGDAMKRGISGGQKKRVTTGEMLVGPAKVVVMDEISNGLDSSTTFEMMSHIREMAHTLNMTVLVSLLQPAPETFDLFDDVILLSEGRIVYQGPRDSILDFFHHAAGFKCPERKAVADFLQEVTSKKDQQQYCRHHHNGPYNFVSALDFAEAFDSFHVGRKLRDDLITPHDKKSKSARALSKEKYGGVSSSDLIRACFDREWLLMKRNSFVYVFKTAQMTVTAVVAFTVFFRTEMPSGRLTDGGKFFGALFFTLVNVMFNGMAELSMTVSRLPVFYKQRDLLFYPAWAFCLPVWVLRLPFSVVESTIWIVLTYYTIGFAPAPERFFRQLVTLISLHQMALSLFRFIGAVGRTQVVATTLGTFTLLVITVFGGFIVAKEDLPRWLKWAYYVSPMSYGQNAIVMNEFLDKRWSSPNTDPRFDQPTVGKVLLQSRGFYTEDYWFWICVGALIGFSILFNLLFVAALTYLNPLGGSNNVTVAVEGDNTKNKETSSKVNESPKRGMVLPFQPLSLVFDRVNYYVDMPNEMKAKGADSDRLQLLNDVSGAFTPGVLTALVGVSGAGKTTLMDVLAGRKNGGYVEGSITISGYPKKQDTFARISGYCEQTDIHSAHVTVYESLLYSAWLRLPAEVNKETRTKFVEEVMEMVELNPIGSSLVGLPGVDGLSTEQRKRLTIAVELVANPSIIFMDEPTSGLDARAAAIVMRAVNSTVDTGRTVVCTIHQPSIDIFEAFDQLLLMKRGGRVIYAGPLGRHSHKLIEYFDVRNKLGPLGRHSHKLIEYFDAVPGVPKIKDGYNPATWMLDITTPASEAQLGLDFADIYDHSSLYQRNQELINELSTKKPGSKDLHYPTKYSQPHFIQFQACFWKQYWSYWRHTQYNAIRFFITIVIAVIFGVVFWNKGQKAGKQQDLQDLLGATYTAVIILGPTNSNSVQAHVSKERRVFYRERAAGMYSPLPYASAQVAVETIYIAAQSAIFSLVLYPMIGFEWTLAKFFWFYYYMFTCFVYFAAYGMMLIALTPDLQTAAITAASSRSLWNLFSGFLIPRTQIPIWWRWYYWGSPVAWTIYGLITCQLGDLSSEVEIPGVGLVTVQAYLKDSLGFERGFLPVVALMHLVFILLFLFVFAFGVKCLNFQRR